MLNMFDVLEAYESVVIKIAEDLNDTFDISLKEVFGEELSKAIIKTNDFQKTRASVFTDLKSAFRLSMIQLLKQFYEENNEITTKELVNKVINSNKYKSEIDEIKKYIVKTLKDHISEEDIKTLSLFNDLFGTVK